MSVDEDAADESSEEEEEADNILGKEPTLICERLLVRAVQLIAHKSCLFSWDTS